MNTRIVLSPDSDDPAFEAIVLHPGHEGELQVIAEHLGNLDDGGA